MGETELCAHWIIWRIIVKVLSVLMINMITIVIVPYDDPIVFLIIVGWFVVVSLSLWGYCGGDKTYFRGILSLVFNISDTDFTNVRCNIPIGL